MEKAIKSGEMKAEKHWVDICVRARVCTCAISKEFDIDIFRYISIQKVRKILIKKLQNIILKNNKVNPQHNFCSRFTDYIYYL